MISIATALNLPIPAAGEVITAIPAPDGKSIYVEYFKLGRVRPYRTETVIVVVPKPRHTIADAKKAYLN